MAYGCFDGVLGGRTRLYLFFNRGKALGGGFDVLGGVLRGGKGFFATAV